MTTRVCIEPGCPELALAGKARCAAHQRPNPYDAAWRRARPAVLVRAGRQCEIRGPRCTGVATTVDHVVPVLAGGARLDAANLRAACGPCNYGRQR